MGDAGEGLHLGPEVGRDHVDAKQVDFDLAAVGTDRYCLDRAVALDQAGRNDPADGAPAALVVSIRRPLNRAWALEVA